MVKNRMLLLVFPAMLVWTSVSAGAIAVGSGDNRAGLYIEWKDGYSVEFEVGFAAESVTGLGLFDIVEANSSLTTVRGDFGFGVFVDGISFEGHENIGFGGGEDWWHYWVKDTGEEVWTSPWDYGVSDRVVSNGSMDGWVYGRAGSAPEPLSVALILLGSLGLRRRLVGKNGIVK